MSEPLKLERREACGAYLRADGDLLRFRFTTDGIDRHRSVIDTKGMITSRFSGMFLWGHDSGSIFESPDLENVLGRMIKVERVTFDRKDRKLGPARGNGLEGPVKFASQESTRAALAERLVRARFLGQTSIGFIPGKSEMREVDSVPKKEVRVFIQSELLEVSLVPVPSNVEVQSFLRSIIPPADQGEDRIEYAEDAFSRGTRYNRIPAAELLDALREIASQDEHAQEFAGIFGAISEQRAKPPSPRDADAGAATVQKAMRQWLMEQRVRRQVRRALAIRK